MLTNVVTVIIANGNIDRWYLSLNIRCTKNSSSSSISWLKVSQGEVRVAVTSYLGWSASVRLATHWFRSAQSQQRQGEPLEIKSVGPGWSFRNSLCQFWSILGSSPLGDLCGIGVDTWTEAKGWGSQPLLISLKLDYSDLLVLFKERYSWILPLSS